jgi:hypothetical protein
MTVTPYPNGASLTSTALTVSQVNQLFQNWTCAAIGVNPPDYSLVRVDWPTEGQPFVDATDNVCFLRAVIEDDPYDKLRDQARNQVAAPAPVTYTWTYTRVWSISWTFYGPAGTDNARAVRSALFLDYFTDLLAASQLFHNPDHRAPTRIPERMNAQWYERVDFSCQMNEFVTETTAVPSVTSVPVTTVLKDISTSSIITI